MFPEGEHGLKPLWWLAPSGLLAAYSMKCVSYNPESLNLRSVLDLLLHIEMQYDRVKNHLQI